MSLQLLFLDDCKNRTRDFRREFPFARLVETVEDTIACLDAQAWDIVFLDHDLNQEAWCDPNRNDVGMEVVRWIVSNKPQVGQFIVHTHNDRVAPTMVRKLSSANYKVRGVPFIDLWKMGVIDDVTAICESRTS